MKKAVLLFIGYAAACSAAGRLEFRGPLATIAENFHCTSRLTCHHVPPSDAGLGINVAHVCDGLVADTLLAILADSTGSVFAVRRLWSSESAEAPNSGERSRPGSLYAEYCRPGHATD